MVLLEYLVIAFAPSLTLGIVVFLAKNWFLERLKNSIKHEYDVSLEKFKSELKIESDKELEEIKAILKKQTDVSLEDYRFQIEIRKKWLNDVMEASIEYLSLVRGQINTVQEFAMTSEPVPLNTKDECFKKCLEKISKNTVNLTSLTFKLEILIFGVEPFTTSINKNMTAINDVLGEMSLHHHYKRVPIDIKSERYIKFEGLVNDFKNNMMTLLKTKTENL